MTRYVILHKLSRGFKECEFHGNNIPRYRETVPTMNEEFTDWYNENMHLVKKVHTEKMVELDQTQIVFEFHNEEDALLCMLTFS